MQFVKSGTFFNVQPCKEIKSESVALVKALALHQYVTGQMRVDFVVALITGGFSSFHQTLRFQFPISIRFGYRNIFAYVGVL